MDTRKTSDGKWRPTPGGFVRMASISLAGLLLIIPSGALVRLTDSGLGCPDWPGCNGEVIPPLSGHAWIEYSNRIFSAIVVIVAVITWIAAVRMPDAPRRVRRWAAVPAVAGLLQGPLGAFTVLFDLHPLLVSSHFLLSILALAGGVVVVLVARDHRDGRIRATARKPALLATSGAIALAGVIVTGVLVTAAGPHSGDPAVIRRLGNLPDAAAIHVRVVIAFCILALATAVHLIRTRPADRLTIRLGVLFVPLIALQIALGEYQYRNQLPWEVILAHVTVAGCIWSCGIAVAWLTAQPQSSAPSLPSTQAAPPRVPLPSPTETTVARQASNT